MGKTAKIMRKAYYIECKIFVHSGEDYYMMCSDLGTMPFIELSQKKGIARYETMIKTYNNLLNYQTVKEYTPEEIGIGNCMAKTELHHKKFHHITFISLYQIWI